MSAAGSGIALSDFDVARCSSGKAADSEDLLS
jgi:hypothetical protein